jgi:hypothetical protein
MAKKLWLFYEPLTNVWPVEFAPVEDAFSTAWCSLSPNTVFVSGSPSFFDKLSGALRSHPSIIWTAVEDFFGVHHSKITRRLNNHTRTCFKHGLYPIRFTHSDYGGATSAVHVLGFSPSFGLDPASFIHPPNVRRSISHFWDPAEPNCKILQTIHKPFVPSPPLDPPRFEYGRDHVLNPAGLLPVFDPCARVAGPFCLKPGKTVVRRLMRKEVLALFDVPTALYPHLCGGCTWNSTSSLPFESDVSQVILTSLFRLLWNTQGGGNY